MINQDSVAKAVETLDNFNVFYIIAVSPSICIGGLFIINPHFFLTTDFVKIIAIAFGISFLSIAFFSITAVYFLLTIKPLLIKLNIDLSKSTLTIIYLIIMIINSNCIALSLIINSMLAILGKITNLSALCTYFGSDSLYKYGTWALTSLILVIWNILNIRKIYLSLNH